MGQSTYDQIEGHADRLLEAGKRWQMEQSPLRDILCASCSNGTVMRRANGEVRAYCAMLSGADGRFGIPTDIEECSSYNRKNTLGLWDLSQMAVEVDPRVGGHSGNYA